MSSTRRRSSSAAARLKRHNRGSLPSVQFYLSQRSIQDDSRPKGLLSWELETVEEDGAPAQNSCLDLFSRLLACSRPESIENKSKQFRKVFREWNESRDDEEEIRGFRTEGIGSIRVGIPLRFIVVIGGLRNLELVERIYGLDLKQLGANASERQEMERERDLILQRLAPPASGTSTPNPLPSPDEVVQLSGYLQIRAADESGNPKQEDCDAEMGGGGGGILAAGHENQIPLVIEAYPPSQGSEEQYVCNVVVPPSFSSLFGSQRRSPAECDLVLNRNDQAVTGNSLDLRLTNDPIWITAYPWSFNFGPSGGIIEVLHDAPPIRTLQDGAEVSVISSDTSAWHQGRVVHIHSQFGIDTFEIDYGLETANQVATPGFHVREYQIRPHVGGTALTAAGGIDWASATAQIPLPADRVSCWKVQVHQPGHIRAGILGVEKTGDNGSDEGTAALLCLSTRRFCRAGQEMPFQRRRPTTEVLKNCNSDVIILYDPTAGRLSWHLKQERTTLIVLNVPRGNYRVHVSMQESAAVQFCVPTATECALCDQPEAGLIELGFSEY